MGLPYHGSPGIGYFFGQDKQLSAAGWRAGAWLSPRSGLLVEGVPVDYRASDGSIRSARARLIDFGRTEDSDFLAVNQFTVLGSRERRPDVVLFVNGLPLVLMELKRPGDENTTLRGAFNQIQTYRAQILDIFTWNQVTVISEGEARGILNAGRTRRKTLGSGSCGRGRVVR